MAKGTRRSTRTANNPVPNLSSDWYWEQDAELRFTRVEVRSGDLVEEKDGLFRAREAELPLLAYYANSITHVT